MNREKLIRKFDRQSDLYVVRRKKQTERQWRERLIRDASGRILEVAVGAGANFPYYPPGTDLTAADFSPGMLDKARAAAADYGLHPTFIHADVESLDFADHAFDTIVSTLSFCGYDDPTRVLKLFNRWCKPGGRILMMEHGISSSRIVGLMQKGVNPLFKRMVGCNLDRDIVGIVRSQLVIEKMEAHMIGAVRLIWAKPRLLGYNGAAAYAPGV